MRGLKFFFEKSEKNIWIFCHLQSKILLKDYDFWHFSTPTGYLGKCGKMPNHSKIAPGGLGLSLNKSLIFSEFPIFFLQNPLKNRKKKKTNFFLKKVQLYDLNFHVFFGKKNYENFFHPQKWYFAIFSQIPKSGWNTGVGDGDGDGENFLMGKCCENEMT